MPINVIVDPNSGMAGDITGGLNVGGGNEWFSAENAGILEFNTFDVDGIIEANLVANVWELSLGVVPPANGGLGVAFTDPNADRMIFWDDSAGAHAYLAPGNSLAITNTTLDTIQDIRTTASPTFANVLLSNNGTLRAGQALNDTAILQAYDVDGGTYANLLYLTSANSPYLSIYDAAVIQGYNGSFSIGTGLTAGNATLISAYDVDGATPVTFITLSAGNTPTCNLEDTVTKAGNYIYRAGGTDVALADGGLGTSLTDPNADRLLFWDDSAGVMAFLAPITTNIISGTTLQLASGTYTPTLTNVTNVAASVAATCQYTRVGDVVTVSGMFQLDPTSASIATELGISLPIASDFTLFTQCSGTAHAKGSVSLGGAILADTTNNRASLQYINTAATANDFWHFTFTYIIV